MRVIDLGPKMTSIATEHHSTTFAAAEVAAAVGNWGCSVVWQDLQLQFCFFLEQLLEILDDVKSCIMISAVEFHFPVRLQIKLPYHVSSSPGPRHDHRPASTSVSKEATRVAFLLLTLLHFCSVTILCRCTSTRICYFALRRMYVLFCKHCLHFFKDLTCCMSKIKCTDSPATSWS